MRRAAPRAPAHDLDPEVQEVAQQLAQAQRLW
jgi:hypothetical protein